MNLSCLESNKPSKVHIQLNTQKTSQGCLQYEYFFHFSLFFSSLSLPDFNFIDYLWSMVFFFNYDIDRKIETKPVWQSTESLLVDRQPLKFDTFLIAT